MYNVYVQDRLEARKRAESEKQRQKRVIEQKRLSSRDSLAGAYRKRIEKFMVSMVQNPLTAKPPPPLHPQSPNFSYRQTSAKPFLGSSVLRYAERSEQTRLKREASIVDTSAIEPHKTFRSRNIEKEIHPKLKFSPSTTMERINDTLKLQVPYLTQLRSPKVRSSAFLSATFDQSPEATTPREVNSPLHFKTHFKAVQTLTLANAASSLRAPSRDEAKTTVSRTQQETRRTSTLHQPTTVSAVKTVTLPVTDRGKLTERVAGLPNNADVVFTDEQTSQLAEAVMEKCKIKPGHYKSASMFY